MATAETHRAIEAVFRIEQARLIAGLARMVRDVGLAEELAQDALVIALNEWPKGGVPHNPGAWLMAAAKRRAIDGLRRETMLAKKRRDRAGSRDGTRCRRRGHRSGDRRRHRRRASRPDLHRLPSGLVGRGARGADPAPDRRADHRRDRPRLPVERSDVAQRIVRAKQTLGKAGLTFAVPRGKERDSASPRCWRSST